MEDHEVLQHLLELESKAAGLVNDAQAEADRRVSEGAKQFRKSYDEVYAREVEELEAAFDRSIAAVKENYRKQLAEYEESLKKISFNQDAFSGLAQKFLLNLSSFESEL